MISVEEAQERILRSFHPLEPERVSLFEALGRVLAEDIFADVSVPPLDNTAMDGYAVRAADTRGASPEHPVALRVVYDLAAGYVSDIAVTPGTAMRIMTGAPIPEGADAVVPFEETDEKSPQSLVQPPEAEEQAGISLGPQPQVLVFKEAQVGANIRRAGEDIRQGERVLAAGTVVRPAEVGVLASVGRATVLCHRRPRVAILATGDELVEIEQKPGPGQIRNSNNYTLAAAVQRDGGVPLLLGIARDRLDELTAKIHHGLSKGADLLLTSGGVSVGDFDVVKNVLATEGEITFWRVHMKPGKPLAFGHIKGVPHLGLPGNPVSSLVSYELFARPAILQMLGHSHFRRPELEATLLDAILHKDGRRHYVRVIVQKEDGGYTARLTGEQGSGILTSMAKANGLAIIPEEATSLAPGSRVRVMLLDWPEQVF
jgi:molybdopterin molybdotransferase